MENYKNKSKSPEKVKVKYTIENIIDITNLINTNKQYSESKMNELRKQYKFNRNEKKPKFFSCDYIFSNNHIKNNFLSNKSDMNNYNINDKFNNDYFIKDQSNNGKEMNNTYTKMNNNEFITTKKQKSTYFGFDKIMQKFSFKIESNKKIPSNNNYNTHLNINENYIYDDIDRSEDLYDFDRKVDASIKINDIKPFNLSYMKLNKTNKPNKIFKNKIDMPSDDIKEKIQNKDGEGKIIDE